MFWVPVLHFLRQTLFYIGAWFLWFLKLFLWLWQIFLWLISITKKLFVIAQKDFEIWANTQLQLPPGINGYAPGTRSYEAEAVYLTKFRNVEVERLLFPPLVNLKNFVDKPSSYIKKNYFNEKLAKETQIYNSSNKPCCR